MLDAVMLIVKEEQGVSTIDGGAGATCIY